MNKRRTLSIWTLFVELCVCTQRHWDIKKVRRSWNIKFFLFSLQLLRTFCSQLANSANGLGFYFTRLLIFFAILFSRRREKFKSTMCSESRSSFLSHWFSWEHCISSLFILVKERKCIHRSFFESRVKCSRGWEGARKGKILDFLSRNFIKKIKQNFPKIYFQEFLFDLKKFYSNF